VLPKFRSSSFPVPVLEQFRQENHQDTGAADGCVWHNYELERSLCCNSRCVLPWKVAILPSLEINQRRRIPLSSLVGGSYRCNTTLGSFTRSLVSPQERKEGMSLLRGLLSLGESVGGVACYICLKIPQPESRKLRFR
jgi:hypothetical protein